MPIIWYVALGSALGGAGRYVAGDAVQRLFHTTFPTGTLAVNVTGSFVLGLLIRYALVTPGITPEMRAFLTIGICGGYTTFSTFSYETARMLEDGEWSRAGVYTALSVLLSLAAVFAGFAAARQIIALRVH